MDAAWCGVEWGSALDQTGRPSRRPQLGIVLRVPRASAAPGSRSDVEITLPDLRRRAGKIPVLRTGTLDVVDSSVICQYLERLHPEPALYPAEPSAFARALWIEEFVDGGLAPHVLSGLLRERVFAPRFLGRAGDQALIKRSLDSEIPPKLAYLEGALDGNYMLGNALTIADLTVASMLLNFTYAGERLAAYPKLERHLRARLRDPKMKPAFAAELEAARGLEGLDLTLLREALA